RRELEVSVRESDGEIVVDWDPSMVFPGLREGEALRRETALPPRAAILARDGAPLAAGEPRITALGASAAQAIGVLGPPPAERAAAVAARGLPSATPVGLSGLEESFEGRLAGRPGGRLFAGSRVAASTKPRRGRDVRTTIDPRLQNAAIEALAGRFGGAVAVDPANGEVLAFAGAAAGAPQPPGSVFKIITLAAALEHRVVTPGQRFPVQTGTILSGVRLENANGESCGGSLRDSFAHSCNSVFAPLGVRVGAARLVAMAERFGFNRPPALPGEQPSTIPDGSDLGDDLGVGSTAIGQGRLLATTVQMASVAATIAADGTRHVPNLVLGEPGARRRVLRPRIARSVASAMAAVVAEGTGTAAAIPGVEVAGKTGTAELRSSVPDPSVPEPAGVDDPTDTDAWFVAFAPRRDPEVAVGILLVSQGTGGATAAPAARILLQAGVRPG
ncbi:MAG: Cell division protein FtsI [Peptidoglycan synthetase], partial [uncultured Solirubrobacteraceae bacterium]